MSFASISASSSAPRRLQRSCFRIVVLALSKGEMLPPDDAGVHVFLLISKDIDRATCGGYFRPARDSIVDILHEYLIAFRSDRRTPGIRLRIPVEPGDDDDRGRRKYGVNASARQ